MAVKTSTARTSAADLQLAMENPSEIFVRRYALEVFGEQILTDQWLEVKVPALGNESPDTLLKSAVDENLRRVLAVLVQLDYGVAG